MPQINDDTPTSAITIQGLSFEAPQPYKAGPIELSEGEASALNQTLAENLRNNFAPQIKSAVDNFRKANNLAEDAEVAVDQLDKDALDEAFWDYAKDYEFGVRRLGGARVSMDPVDREAYNIALAQVKAAVKAKGYKLDSISKEKMGEFVKQVLDKHPEIREEAKRRVEVTKGIALGDLEV